MPLFHIPTTANYIAWMVFMLGVKHPKWPHFIGTWPIICKIWRSKTPVFESVCSLCTNNFGWSNPFHQWIVGGSCSSFVQSICKGAMPKEWRWNTEIKQLNHQAIDWALFCKNKLKFNQASQTFVGSVPLLCFGAAACEYRRWSKSHWKNKMVEILMPCRCCRK